MSFILPLSSATLGKDGMRKNGREEHDSKTSKFLKKNGKILLARGRKEDLTPDIYLFTMPRLLISGEAPFYFPELVFKPAARYVQAQSSPKHRQSLVMLCVRSVLSLT